MCVCWGGGGHLYLILIQREFNLTFVCKRKQIKAPVLFAVDDNLLLICLTLGACGAQKCVDLVSCAL